MVSNLNSIPQYMVTAKSYFDELWSNNFQYFEMKVVLFAIEAENKLVKF